MTEEFPVCVPVSLPPELAMEAASHAVSLNPANAPAVAAATSVAIEPEHLALLTSKYWGPSGVRLTVSFTETTPRALKEHILRHMNSWGQFCNVHFSLSSGRGQVRISRVGSGYWSYLGTDILLIPKNQPTMNLQGFSNSTPEEEFIRVVSHETGHTLGMNHEHLRRELVERLDVEKTIAYFKRTQGWTEADIRYQVLTPVEERLLTGSKVVDEDSIMCYELPGSITKDGRPIRGGDNFSALDRKTASILYPLTVQAPEEGMPRAED